MSALDPASVRALVEFAGGAAPAAGDLVVEAEALSLERLADVALGLAVIGAVWGVGRLLRSGAPGLRPVVFASAVTGLLMLTVVNPLFWELAGVTVDQRVTVRRFMLADRSVDLCDLAAARIEPGELFPAVSDDTTLVLVGRSGERVELPRFAPRSAEVAATIVARLEDGTCTWTPRR
ncbi:MAG: hypothetical protein AMXMBFR64_56440 [Myxococcales bacterium]